MTKEAQERIEAQFRNKQGQNSPCSNQIVNNFIVTSSQDDYLHRFIDSINGKYINYRHSAKLDKMILPSGECFYIIDYMRANRGYRFYKIYIDSRLSEEYIYNCILPYCGSYCCMLKFF